MEKWETQEYKSQVLRQLRAIDFSEYDLTDGGETRLLEYCSEVRDKPDGHNLFELLAVIRFFRFMRQYVFRWRKVHNYVMLYESLKFSGLTGRQSYKATPVQYFQFANIKGFYEWKETDISPRDARISETLKVSDGKVYELRRLCRDVLLFIPRKFSKTTSVAAFAVDELLMGDNNAQAYCAANAYKQAKVCFDEIKKTLKPLDPRKTYFKSTRETITWRDDNVLGKESKVECLSGGADAKDGLAASLVIFDEYAAAKYTKDHSEAAELLQVLTSSMGIRKEPLTIIITSGGRVPNGPFKKVLENAMNVLLGEIEQDSMFAHLFMPDGWECSADNYGDPNLWRKVNPHIGITVQQDYYREWWNKAQVDPEIYLEFVTKFLNILHSPSVQDWIPVKAIEDRQTDEAPAERYDTMCSLDLSVRDDFSCAGYVTYIKPDKSFYVDADFYIPEETLRTHPNKVLYQTWVDAGWLKVCPGKVISQQMIVNDVLERNRSMRILQIGYDKYKAQETVNALRSAISSLGSNPDDILRSVPQTYGAFTSPVETFEFCLDSRPSKVSFSRNPILPYCFGNCYLDEDRMGNKRPIKRQRNSKIDGAICTLMDFWLFNNYEQHL